MSLHLRIPCPQCGKILYRKRDGQCPSCATPVSAHVEEVRDREERIEKIVAVIGTALVLVVLMLAGGVGLFEGVIMYGVAGATMFYLAKKTFKPNAQSEEESGD